MSPSTTPTLDYAPHHDDAPPPPARKSLARKIFTSLTFWIVLGTAVGIVLGEVAPKFSKQAAPMAQLFLRPIQFIVFPLVFSSLVVGIAGQTDMKQLGRLSIKSFIYFEIVTTIALVIGLIAVNIVKPGNSSVQSKGEYKPTSSSTGLSLANWINHLAPKTWGEMMGGSGSSELLQVLVASILTGVATAQLHDQAAKRLIVEFARAVMEMMFKFVDIVIWTAPIGVCFAVANAIGANGMSALSSLGALVATVYGTLIFFVVVVFVPILLLFKINPISFLSAMREPLIIAYTTATSEAALPKVFEALDEYGVATNISAFVVPFGYSFNLDGTTLYLSLSAVFCAQAAGVHKSVGEQIVMVLMLMVSSKGVAGVRSAAIIVLASTLEQFDVPSWPVALILGADWFMDMGRTFTNVLGNCIAAVIMAKLENEFRTPQWEHDRQMRLQLASEQEEAEKAMQQSKLSVHEA
jgi:proton glutamate symport protein